MLPLLLTLTAAFLAYLSHPQQALFAQALGRFWITLAALTAVLAWGFWLQALGPVAGSVAWLAALMLGWVLGPLLVVHAGGLRLQRSRGRS